MKDGTQIEDIEAVVRIVQALERRFPDHNSGFAYGTRLCEETGELVEAITDYDGNDGEEGRVHLVKELQDVLRVVIGILHTYGRLGSLPQNLQSAQSKPYSSATDLIVDVAMATGQLANAINHKEGAGIKRQTLGNNPDERIVEKAQSIISILDSIINRYGIRQEMDDQITAAYRRYQELGYIT